MPEGDTIAWTANRIRPVLVDRVPDEILTPQPRHSMDRWPQRLAGRRVQSVDTHGKHLFLRFDGGLVLHSHLALSGSWQVLFKERAWRRAWFVLRAAGRWVAEFDGPVLELMTEGRVRFDQRLAALGPDVLADQFEFERFLTLLRGDDPTRPIGDALLDQRTVAGIGNIWKAEGCWEAGVDPWRPVADVSDAEAAAIISDVRPRMQRSAELGPRETRPRVYLRHGRPCPRCGGSIATRGQARGSARSPSWLAKTGPAPRHPAANRTTYWCPACQS